MYSKNIVHYLLLKDTTEIKSNETAVYWFLEKRDSLQCAALCTTLQTIINFYKIYNY